ncbi:Hydrogen cyanide synthase subunit HcnC precursor [Nereida ignava]|uniref:Hydrogen cyanide synthase subunit HcnC n=1 Tax=Nereida ignava TaxID=282199 RepID=A0A0U1NNJ5_9RHOB|nr:FAD-dependent oxidoreductase [Nereida ignava]CRK76278.1 Hydrogen cyanide synthase subunit HcnC precursor [Nereida ignava]SFJ81893.1 Glycine/D-amino acid oxidase [Nereida ignava DSM 16309]
MNTQNTADTLVIGGGLVGAAVAWGLARQGEKVILLDEGDVALRASRGNFGLVWVQSKGSGMHDYARWTRRSADLWPEFADCLAEDSGISPDYHKPGGLHFCLSEDEMENVRALNTRMHNVNGALGYGAEMLDRKQLDKLVPGLGPDVVGGSYGKHDGHANPLSLLRSLHAALAERGGRYASDARAEAVEPDGSGYCVTTPKGVFRGAKVVLAAGHGNSRLAPQLGLDIPLRPEKGQILVTERAAPLLPMPTHLLRQTADGTVMMGDSHEDTGYSTWSGTPVMAQIARNAIRCFPALADLRIIRSWAAVRILTPDGAPIYQQSQTHPGIFSLNCHSGVTLAGAHALALAPMIAAGELTPDMGAFSSRRFHGQTN